MPYLPLPTRRDLLLGALAFGSVGCRCRSVVDDAPPVQTDLSPPWTDWDLPIRQGRVVFSNRRMVTVVYPTDSPEHLALVWRAHLLSRGWSQTSDVSGADMYSYGFEQGPRTLALGVYPGTDGVVVTLTLFTPGDEPEAGEPG